MSQDRELFENDAGRFFWMDTQDVKEHIKNETELRFLFVFDYSARCHRFSPFGSTRIHLTMVGSSGMLWEAAGVCGVQRTIRPCD